MRKFAWAGTPMFRGHLGRISDLAFSPDGTLIASAGEDDMTVRVWRVATGELLRVLVLGPLDWWENVSQAVFSPDGSTLYTYAVDLRAYEVATGELRWTRRVTSREEIRLSPDGRWCAVGRRSDYLLKVRILDLDRRRFTNVRFETRGWLKAFSPDGSLILTDDTYQSAVYDDVLPEVFRVTSGERVGTTSAHGSRMLAQFAEAPVLLVNYREQEPMSAGERIEVVSLNEEGRSFTVRLPLEVRLGDWAGESVKVLPNRTELIACQMHGTAKVLDLDEGKVLRDLPDGLSYDTHLAVSPDGTRVAIGDASGSIRLFETREWRLERIIRGGGPMGQLAVDVESRFLAMVQGNCDVGPVSVHLWDLGRLEHIGLMTPDRRLVRWIRSVEEVGEVAFIPELSWLGSAEGEAWERARWAQTKRHVSEECQVTLGIGTEEIGSGIAVPEASWPVGWPRPSVTVRRDRRRTLSQDGRWLAVVEEDRAFVIDTTTGRVVRSMMFPPPKPDREVGGLPHVVATAISTDGLQVAVGFSFAQYDVLRFDFDRGRAVEHSPCCDTYDSLAFRPDGSALAVGDAYQNTISVFESRRSRRPRVWTAHAQAIRSLAYTPDGRFLISAADDGLVTLWEAENGNRHATLMVLSPPGSEEADLEWIAYTSSGDFNGSQNAEAFFVGV